MKWLILLGVLAMFWLALFYISNSWVRPTTDMIERTKANELKAVESAIKRSDDPNSRDWSNRYGFD